MKHDWFHLFTIFKCDYNVGVTIISYLFDVVEATMTSDVYVHILNLIERCFFCEHFKKYLNCISREPSAIHPKIFRNCPPTENLHSKKSEEIPVLYAVEATFAIIYMCLLISAGLNFSIKYVSCHSLEILLSSRISNSGIILKFPPLHLFVWLSTSICCNWVVEYVVFRYLIFL